MSEVAIGKLTILKLMFFLQTSNPQSGWPVLKDCLLAAGFGENLSAHTFSGFRCCGLQAAQDVATQIRKGSVEIAIAMGADCVKQHRDALSPAHDVSLSPLEAIQPYESTNLSGLGERGPDVPSTPQDQFAVQGVQDTEKAQACAIHGQVPDPFAAASSAYENDNSESDIQREEGSSQRLKPERYEGNNCSCLSP